MTSRSRPTPAANGSKWIRPTTRWAIYYRDDFVCVYCNVVPTRPTIDHLIDAARGGGNGSSNLVTCCLSCNSSKKDLSIRSWFQKLRKRGFNTERIRGRIARLVRKPLDRERGRFLASTRERHGEDYENRADEVQPLLEADQRRDGSS